jgi:diguanylate cyclase (GGDEF)-like protein
MSPRRMDWIASFARRLGAPDEARRRAATPGHGSDGAIDKLTGLLNRPAFVTELQRIFPQAARSGTPFAVFYLDIDHFRNINTVHGHEIGDLFLIAVAKRLKNAVREIVTPGRLILARFGGDEFAILQATSGSASDTADFAQRLGAVLSEPYSIRDKTIHATVSVGISLYSPTADAPNDSLMQAELALHRAKSTGRNRFNIHSSDLIAAARERAMIAEDLHTAVRNGELMLHYQPQVEVHSGRIVAVEALMRWNHPVRGLLSPNEFIPVAEKFGTISALGLWAIEEACAQLSRWRQAGYDPLRMAVNLSAIQLRDTNEFIRKIRKALHRSRLEPHALELELTESFLVEQSMQSTGVLHRLRDIGVRIAVDDFGTGCSSLQFLRDHPVDTIKIAQQFVSHCAENDTDAAIVQAIVRLGGALDVEVVAEGVETAEQMGFLVSAGCTNMQGFYFSPPIQGELLADFLRRGRIDIALVHPAAPVEAL